MKSLDIKDLESTFERPFISVIGSTSPTQPYISRMGIEVGRALRAYLDGRKGSIFTGGVEGVGVDAYAGAAVHCIRSASNSLGELPRSRFFTLIPHFFSSKPTSILGVVRPVKLVDYSLPSEYHLLENLYPQQDLVVVRAGRDMAERRKFLAKTADVMVMLNGSGGTLDEAIQGEESGKPVIVLRGSGGVSDLLFSSSELANLGLLDEPEMLVKSLKLSRSRLVYGAKDSSDVCRILDSILKN